NNKRAGVSLFLRQLVRSNSPAVKNVSIEFNRHIDSLSYKALGITTSSLSDPTFTTALGGNITINCPIWKSPASDTFATVRDPKDNNQCDISFNFPPTTEYIAGSYHTSCNFYGSLENKVRMQLSPLPDNT